MKIYTKTGDLGKTSLFGGERVHKNDSRVEAYGTLDELNSWMGLLRDQEIPNREPLNYDPEILKSIQETLFIIGSQLASDPETPPRSIPEFGQEEIEKLEMEIDKMESLLPALRHFILPGGHNSVSFVHITRNVCRRAERIVVSLLEIVKERPLILMYLNRLSDFLFVLSRYWTEILGVPEYKWVPSTRT